MLPEEQEAFFYKTIASMEELIEQYGAAYIASKLRYPVYMKLYRYFEDV